MPEQVELGSGVRLPEQVELAPGVTVPEPGDGSVLRFDEQAVQDVRDFFGLLCFGQNQWAGRPFQLLPWEVEGIRLFYGVRVQDADGRWVRYRRFLYDELPKKNGKSEFAAGLGLYHLLYDGENRAQVGVFAADKNNADIQVYGGAYLPGPAGGCAAGLGGGQQEGKSYPPGRGAQGVFQRRGDQTRVFLLRDSH